MNFNVHSELSKKHAFLSPSQHHWVNYNDQKLEARFFSWSASVRGTDLHNLAHEAIRLGVKLSSANKTLSMYVNDAINYKMTCEQSLYYSDNCFGSADTISFRKNKLRIHDLKTGVTPAHHRQLEIYAALFCLEYNVDPLSIETELRIYQSGEIQIYDADPEVVISIMDKIIDFDMKLQFMKERGIV